MAQTVPKLYPPFNDEPSAVLPPEARRASRSSPPLTGSSPARRIRTAKMDSPFIYSSAVLLVFSHVVVEMRGLEKMASIFTAGYDIPASYRRRVHRRGRRRRHAPTRELGGKKERRTAVAGQFHVTGGRLAIHPAQLRRGGRTLRRRPGKESVGRGSLGRARRRPTPACPH